MKDCFVVKYIMVIFNLYINMKIFKFYAEWCGPCKALTKQLDTMNLSVEVTPIDIENDDQDLTTKFKIRSVPTLVFVDDNENELERLTGSQSNSAIENIISKYA